MSKMPWFRLYAEFATDAKIQSMSETLQRRYIMLLCLKCNDELHTLTDDELAFALRIDEKELQETREKFIQKGLIKDGWEIVAWDKRQYKTDSSAGRVRKHREKKRYSNADVTTCNVTVTAPDTDTDTDISVTNVTDRGANAPELTKPKRNAKRACQLPDDWEPLPEAKAPLALIGMTPEEIIAEVDKFRDYHRAKGSTMKDWNAAYRNWVRNAMQYRASRPQPRQGQPPGEHPNMKRARETTERLLEKYGHDGQNDDTAGNTGSRPVASIGLPSAGGRGSGRVDRDGSGQADIVQP